WLRTVALDQVGAYTIVGCDACKSALRVIFVGVVRGGERPIHSVAIDSRHAKAIRHETEYGFSPVVRLDERADAAAKGNGRWLTCPRGLVHSLQREDAYAGVARDDPDGAYPAGRRHGDDKTCASHPLIRGGSADIGIDDVGDRCRDLG